MEERAKYIRSGWLLTSLYSVFTGLFITIILSLFTSAERGRMVSLRFFLVSLFFSVFVSVGVTSAILLGQSIFRLSHERIWQFILIYYACCTGGMIAGVEMTYLSSSLIFGEPYTFFHLQDILFSGLIVLIVSSIAYTYRSQKSAMNSRIRMKELDLMRLSQLKTQAELAALHSKINPHFLYNSLNSIASLIHEDPGKAESMTLKLSRLFRYSINQSQEDLVSVREELEVGQIFMDIEKLRFGDRVNFKLDVEESLLDKKLPRFLIQPLVENALKHGLANVIQNGELYIGIHQREGKTVIEIADSGSPFPDELQTGYGLQSTYDKLALLYGDNYEIQISNEPRKQIKIIIP